MSKYKETLYGDNIQNEADKKTPGYNMPNLDKTRTLIESYRNKRVSNSETARAFLQDLKDILKHGSPFSRISAKKELETLEQYRDRLFYTKDENVFSLTCSEAYDRHRFLCEAIGSSQLKNRDHVQNEITQLRRLNHIGSNEFGHNPFMYQKRLTTQI